MSRSWPRLCGLGGLRKAPPTPTGETAWQHRSSPSAACSRASRRRDRQTVERSQRTVARACASRFPPAGLRVGQSKHPQPSLPVSCSPVLSRTDGACPRTSRLTTTRYRAYITTFFSVLSAWLSCGHAALTRCELNTFRNTSSRGRHYWKTQFHNRDGHTCESLHLECDRSLE